MIDFTTTDRFYLFNSLPYGYTVPHGCAVSAKLSSNPESGLGLWPRMHMAQAWR